MCVRITIGSFQNVRKKFITLFIMHAILKVKCCVSIKTICVCLLIT